MDGKRWYNTGDLVEIESDGFITFKGRLKRFVKVGGEMISLPAIENALQPHLYSSTDKGPTFAVSSIETDGRPRIVLVTTRDMNTKRANSCIIESGLSGLHKINEVITVDALPLLGSGKTDYRELQRMLKN